MEKITKDLLLAHGWEDKGEYMCLKGHPRIGWWENGRVVVGWFDWGEPITQVWQLNKILDKLGYEKICNG